MRRFLTLVFAMLVIAAPVFAQEEGGAGGLPSSLFGSTDFGTRGPQANPMDAVKKFFAQAKVTFSGDQEKAIKPIVEAAFKQVQDTVERFNAQQAAGSGAVGAAVAAIIRSWPPNFRKSTMTFCLRLSCC